MRKPIGLFVLILILCGASSLTAEDATYVYPMRPPIDDLWPPAPYAVNCTGGGVRTARDAGGIVDGILRSSGGRWEIFFGGSWVAYEPRRHKFYADVYYRIGPCWVGGHGHGSDAEVSTAPEVYFPVVHGRPATPMEDIDIRWYPVRQPPLGLYWLRSEWQRLTGSTPPDEKPPEPQAICGDRRCDVLTGEPTTCPQDCCDGICNRASDVVRCPDDCKPVDNPPAPPDPPIPTCPAPDVAACEPFITDLRNQMDVLSAQVRATESKLADEGKRLAAREVEIQILRTERDALQTALELERQKVALPEEIAGCLREIKAKLQFWQRARWRNFNELRRTVCGEFDCPEDLR